MRGSGRLPGGGVVGGDGGGQAASGGGGCGGEFGGGEGGGGASAVRRGGRGRRGAHGGQRGGAVRDKCVDGEGACAGLEICAEGRLAARGVPFLMIRYMITDTGNEDSRDGSRGLRRLETDGGVRMARGRSYPLRGRLDGTGLGRACTPIALQARPPPSVLPGVNLFTVTPTTVTSTNATATWRNGGRE